MWPARVKNAPAAAVVADAVNSAVVAVADAIVTNQVGINCAAGFG